MFKKASTYFNAIEKKEEYDDSYDDEYMDFEMQRDIDIQDNT